MRSFLDAMCGHGKEIHVFQKGQIIGLYKAVSFHETTEIKVKTFLSLEG